MDETTKAAMIATFNQKVTAYKSAL